MVRLWLAGDAESYIKTENNFREWLNEVGRLHDQIKEMSGQDSSVDMLRSLIALISDLDQTSYSILNNLSERERMKKFATATRSIEPDEARRLAEALKAKLSSPAR